MASIRIPYDPNTKVGAKYRAAVSAGVAFRQAMRELQLTITAYDTDSTGLSTDSGIAAGQIATAQGYVQFSDAELGGVTISQINAASKTNTRLFLDAFE